MTDKATSGDSCCDSSGGSCCAPTTGKDACVNERSPVVVAHGHDDHHHHHHSHHHHGPKTTTTTKEKHDSDEDESVKPCKKERSPGVVAHGHDDHHHHHHHHGPTTTEARHDSDEDESVKPCLKERSPVVVAHGHDDHHHHHHHHHHGPTTTTTQAIHDSDEEVVHCLAVVLPENGKTVSVLDASGSVRSFSYQGSEGGGDISNLCFSSHGTDTMTDDLLTPCLDEAGYHGMPDEGCFCGVDIPHLHAHVHDPKLCNNNNEQGPNYKKNNVASSESNWIKLASLTLLPGDDDKHCGSTGEEDRLLQIPASEHMPNECNSKDVLLSPRSSSSETTVQNRRMYPVKGSEPFYVDYGRGMLSRS